MKTIKTDVAIIGAGTAGLNARKEVERAGKSWLLIESGPYGTTCARVGCMPSKLLIAAAEAAHAVEHGAQFGVHVKPDAVKIDGRAVMDRVRRERDRFAGFVVRDTEALPAEQRVHGRARFVGPTTLEVDDHTRVEAGAVVIATGSSPWVPPPFDQIAEHIEVNDDVFDWEDLPESVAVVGTGIIGLELGQALSRLGVETSFFNPFDVIGAYSDPEVLRVAHEVFGESLDLHLGIAEVEAKPVDGGVEISWTERGERRSRRYQKVLAAAGRRPNVKGLGLEATGLALDERGRPAWDAMTAQLGDAPIFMAGDVSGHRPLLHEAADEGRIAGSNAARFPEITAAMRRTPIAVAFTEPQMALVGKSHRELEEGSYVIGEVDYGDQGRARVMGRNQGIARLYARKSDCRLVGAELLSPGAEHLAHLLSWVIQLDLQVQQILELPFYHPVLEEGLRTALRDLARQLRLVGGCPPQDRSECPGA